MSEKKYFINRELQIISLLKKSYLQKMIAEELNVSIETVRSHIKHIKSKLGVHSTLEIINWAHQSDLFKDSDK